MNLDETPPESGKPDDGGLRELQSETLKLLVIAILGIAYVGVIASIAAVPSATPPAPWAPLPMLVGLTLTAGLTCWLGRIGPRASTIGMAAGLTATLGGLVLLHPGTLLAGYFFLIVLAASAASGWRAGLPTAVATSAALLGLANVHPGIVPADLVGQSLLWIWATLALAWLPTRPLRATIHWAWSSYQLAQAQADEARLRQGELARVSKSLAEACVRLERLNRELQEAREAAEAARRTKAEFAATVGHELRTPINLIVGFSQMMASPRRSTYYPEPLPEGYRADLQTIYNNAHHISGLVDDILDLSQIDAHRMALRKEPIDLAMVASEAAASVMPLYAESGLYLSVDVPADVPRVNADPVRIRQVLINLLYNAVRFTQHGGVVVTADPTDDGVVVAVHDTGVGIPPEGLGRIFEEFRQAAGPARGHAGSGLGLAVCKRFVELHGGNIWAESEPDFGTTISFSLPRQANVASTPFHALPALPRGAEGLGVALLDPTGQTLRVLQRYLDDYRVRGIDRPEQALHLQADGELRAMIVTATEAERAWYAFQRLHPEVAAVPTFVFPLRPRRTGTPALNAAAYLTKPVGREQLAQALRRLRRPLRRIAVIEDNPEMRSLLARMLRSIARHASILEAADGDAGLQVIRAVRPDVVVLDLMMPGRDGYAVLDAMQGDAGLGGIPVVVVSARGPDEEVVVGMVGISRHDGLSVGEAMTCLRASLDALLRPCPCEVTDDRAAARRAGPAR